MSACLCGATGFYNRRELAKHIQSAHGRPEATISDVRALTLAQRIIDKLKLSPEDYAIFGVEPPSQLSAPSRARRDEADLPVLPSPEAVRAAVEAMYPSHSVPPTTPPRAGSSARPERRRATPKAAGSTPAPRSTSTPADRPPDSVTNSAPGNQPATPPAPEETPMAKPEKECKVCARLTKKAGEPTKCKRHGGAGVRTATGGGTRRKKPRAAKRPVPEPAPRNGNNPALALIDAEITKMDTRLADLHRARGIVAALGLASS